MRDSLGVPFQEVADTTTMPSPAISSERAIFEKLQAYLQNINRVPEVVQDNSMVAERGAFKPFSGDAGVIKMGPTGDNTTFIHELGHAADVGMILQYYETMNKANLSPSEKQFATAHEKMSAQGAARTPALKMAPEWAKKNEGYRSNALELRGHAIGNTHGLRKEEDKMEAPLHVDSTIATEFEILLDLATRAVLGNRK